MSRFERKAGEPATLRLRGSGFDALRITVAGIAGSAEPMPLVNAGASADGAAVLRFEHEFAAGQLDTFDQLRVDPVVYGRAGAEYDLEIELMNATDDAPTSVATFAGTLMSSRPGGDAGAIGFDAPLFVVALQDRFELLFDEKAGAYVIHTIDLGFDPKDCDAILGATVESPTAMPDFDLLEPKKFAIDLDDSTIADASDSAALGDLGTIGRGAGLGTGAGYGAGAGLGTGAAMPSPRDSGRMGKKDKARPDRIKVIVPDQPKFAAPAKGKRSAKKAQSSKMAVVPPSPPTDAAARHYPVWYGTNRAPVIRDGALLGYSPMRDAAVHYGRCVVRVPKSHKIGEIGSGFWKRLATLTDDRLKVEQVLEVEQDLFWRSVTTQLAAVPEGERHAVVFIHGYNVSFHDAAVRAAQLGCDLNIRGAMAFYSWPSRGTLEGYFADEATVQASAAYITDFLVGVADKVGAEQVHVIAHSMGNRAALEAVHDIVREAGSRSRAAFSQFILAAPDVDAEYFRQLADAYGRVAKRTTMYVSDRDHAVKASRYLHGGVPRVGLAPPFQVVNGIDTVYVGKIDDSLLGHGYVAEDWQLLNDMSQLIHLDAAPAKRFTVRRSDDDRYWELVAG